MQIKNIEIQNFKFHHNLNFELNNKNCLIYGENGSGKSSIYEALYSNFYYYKNKDIANNILRIRDTYIHRDFPQESLNVNITLNNNVLNRNDDTLTNDEILNNNPNIYFVNEKVLRHITDNNFFDIITKELIKHFPSLDSFEQCYTETKRELRQLNENETLNEKVITVKKNDDEYCKEKLNTLIPSDEINHTLKNDLMCDFEIEYVFKDSEINLYNEFKKPTISFKIKRVDDRGDFKNHFNESVFKLISIAVYFTLTKKNETQNELKLLVLDDFLTSLDMSNRKKIARFILNKFEDYQIIILTHNLQFNNLLKKMIDKNIWDIKILFTIKEDNILVAKIKDKNDNFIEDAKSFIDTENYDLAIAGNLLRKAFESIIHEFEQRLELGKVEKLQKIINVLKDNNSYFHNLPHEELNNIIIDFENMLSNEQQPESSKITQVRNKVNSLKRNRITFQDNRSYHILKRADFFKNILMNPSSHNDTEAEIYKEECQNTILLLEELNSMLLELDSNNINLILE